MNIDIYIFCMYKYADSMHSFEDFCMCDIYCSFYFRSTNLCLYFQCVDPFEVPSLDALITEFRETVLDSNQRPLRPSFPSVYTESSMFAARAAAPCMSPIIQDEYGSGSGTAGEDGCPGGGDTTALFVRIQDALSPTSTRMSSDKLMVEIPVLYVR